MCVCQCLYFCVCVRVKILEGFKIPNASQSSYNSLCSIKLYKSLYGLKESRHIWYNHASEYLIKEDHINDPICTFIFIKKSEYEFIIVAGYVDVMDLIGFPKMYK